MSSARTTTRDDSGRTPLLKQPLVWMGLALAMMLVWYQLAFRTSASPLVTLPIAFLSRPRGDLPWLLALVAMVFACALLLTGPARRRLAVADAAAKKPGVKAGTTPALDRACWGAAAFCAVGTSLMYVAPATALPYAGGAIAGMGFAALAIRSVGLVPRPRNVGELFGVGCAALVAAQVVQLMVLFTHVALVQTVLCLTPLAAAGFIHKARCVACAAPENAPVTSNSQEYQLRSHITVITLCFLGLGVYMGIIGFANDSRPADEYLGWQLATAVPGCVIACVALWLSARASVEGPYVISPIMLGTSALVLLLTIMSEAQSGGGAGEVLAHATGRATDGFLFVTAACTMVELAHAGSPRRLRSPAAMLGLSAIALLAGIVVGGIMMSVVGLSVLSITLVAVFLLYGALLSLGLSVQQRSRESYVVVRSSLDVEKIAGAQARMLGEELGTLTAREAEVLPYLLQHLSVDVIAERLGVSRNTVKSHVSHIYEKAGVNSRQQLIDLASAKVINL